MNLEAISQSVQSRMPEKRWIHTLGVISSAEILAGRFGASPDKAKLAAVLHDVCKYWSIDQQANLLREHRLGEDLLDYNKELWHAPLGAYIAETEYQISDREVLDAIRYHTSGRESMTILDKIVCLADYIEPNRNYPGVEKIRELANHHLEKALIAGFDSTIAYLIAQNQRIYPLTILARNDLILHL
jgi:predicted HD superfamily hydrolase involved in NAD metabolism